MSMHQSHYPVQKAGLHPNAVRNAMWAVAVPLLAAVLAAWSLLLLTTQSEWTATAPVQPRLQVETTQANAADVAQGVCGPDFYLTGDLVGDASPAVILGAFCARP